MTDFLSKLKFNCDENDCFIGSKTDPGTIGATGITDINVKGRVVIPKTCNGKEISNIGYYAFYGCSYITEVKLEARVKALYKYAFGHMPSLWSINVPSSCTFLGTCSIYCYNNSNTKTPTAVDTIIIYFELGSKLETIENYAFGRKELVILIMCERIRSLKKVNPIICAMQFTGSIEIYSPYSFSLGNVNSTVKRSMHCYYMTCIIRNRSRSFIKYVLVLQILLS